MCLKKIFLIVLLINLLVTPFLVNLSVEGEEKSSENNEICKINPLFEKNFSKYLNVIDQEHYKEQLVISSLENDKNYNIGTLYHNQYSGTVTIDEESFSIKKNIGFKCNGIFYKDMVIINKSGKYNLSAFNYKIDSNGITKPVGNALENISIYFSIKSGLEMTKNTFYYEKYFNKYNAQTSFIEEISSSFNYDNVYLTEESYSELKENFASFYKIKLNKPSEDISELVNKEIEIKVEYLKETFSFKIKLLTSFNLTQDYNIDNIPKSIFFDNSTISSYSSKLNYSQFSACFIEPIILENISIPDYLECSINFLKTTKTDEYVSQNSEFICFYEIKIGKESEKINVKIKIDSNKNISVFDYSLNYKVFNNKLSFSQTYINPSDHLKQCFCNVIINEETYYDSQFYLMYKNNPNIVRIEADTSKVGKTKAKIFYTISKTDIDNNYLINECNKAFEIDVEDALPPIILTNYNYIIMDNEKILYKKQFKFIDNYKLDENSITFEINEESKMLGGNIVASVSDKNGNKTTETFLYKYKQEESLYQKTFGKFLLKYKELLQKIF